MAKPMTAGDVFALIMRLTQKERVDLMQLIAEQHNRDEASVYAEIPPRQDEFLSDEESLTWEAAGWGPTD